MPKIAELREMDGSVWARLEMDLGGQSVELLSEAEIEANLNREMGYLDDIDRLRAALKEITEHWACQYDHPNKQGPMYAGSYGIGVTDGHRACAIIAEKALVQLAMAKD